MSTLSRPLLTTLVTLPLAACATGGQHGLGTVPTDLVALYDDAAPGGVIEVELERDGSVLSMEADVPVEALPRHVLEAVMELAPDARVTGAEREVTRDGHGWEVKVLRGGVEWEYVLDTDGEILETENAIDASEAPAGVLAAADRAVPGGARRSVEVIRRGTHVEYHVKKRVDGASYKIVVRPDGTVERAVREALAEIEVPLRR